MRPLEGIKVVDATHVIAGPFATYQLALMGAEVIKVEAPGDPDQTRIQGTDAGQRAQGMGSWFLSQSSNKRSLTLDLKQPQAQAVFRQLAAGADVVVQNYRPGAFAELGLDHAALSQLNPRLIYCSLSAFGTAGRYGGRTGYDMVVQASSGLMAMTGTPEVHPVKVGSPVIDYATGLSAAFAITSALLQRQQTGTGQHIDLSMLDVGLILMGLHATSWSIDGHVHQPIGGNGPTATSGTYETKDGLLVIAAANHRQQHRLWHAIGRPDLAKSPEAAWTANRAEEAAVLTAIFLTRSAAEWEDFLQDHHIPAGRVRRLDEAVADPELAHRRVFHRHEGCAGRDAPFLVPVAPFLFAHGGPSVDRAPQPLGADTDAILGELGYGARDIAALRAAGAV